MTENIHIAYERYSCWQQLPSSLQTLVIAARKNSEQAYAPYSLFRVGAAVMLDDGTIVNGNNQENASYPEGLCAERVAMFQASALYPERAMTAIAICGNPIEGELSHPLAPCGGCRQVMAEYEKKSGKPMQVVLCSMQQECILIPSASLLLPFQFSNDDLSTL